MLTTIPAHFDGTSVQFDIPVNLKPNTRLLVTILDQVTIRPNDTHIAQLERQDALGYAKQPAQLDEIAVWESEQVWGDQWNVVK